MTLKKKGSDLDWSLKFVIFFIFSICLARLFLSTYFTIQLIFCTIYGHGFQNRTGPGGRTVKTENRDGNRFFKLKEPDFLLIP